MEIPLNLPPGERQQEFIDQFTAAIRRISSGGSATAEFLEDRSFVATMSGAFRLGPGIEAPITWVFEKTRDGTLSNLRIQFDSSETPAEWSHAAQRLITSALAASLAVDRKPFFQRTTIAYIGPALDGEYWLPGCRLGPAIRDDETPDSPLVERWVDIDMNVNAIDATHASTLAGERALRLATRLSLLLDLGFERPPHEYRWVMVRGDGDSFENRRCQIMFQRTDTSLSAMPEKGKLCKLGSFTPDFPAFPLGRRVKLPLACRRVLRGADTKPHPIGDAFDRCARLYRVGRIAGRHFPSVWLAYAIAAVDAITQSDRSYEGVRDFLRIHGGNAADQPNPLHERLYGEIRSAHFHAGHFPLGEYGPFRADFLLDEKSVEASRLRFSGLAAVREAIIDWCLTKVAAEADDT